MDILDLQWLHDVTSRALESIAAGNYHAEPVKTLHWWFSLPNQGYPGQTVAFGWNFDNSLLSSPNVNTSRTLSELARVKLEVLNEISKAERYKEIVINAKFRQ